MNRITSYNVCYTKLLRTIADGADLTVSAVNGAEDGNGTIIFNGTSNVTADIGATNAISKIYAGTASKKTVTFDGIVSVGTLYVGNGNVLLNDDGDGRLEFTAKDGTVTIASGADWTGVITNSTSGYGNLVLLGSRTINTSVSSGTLNSIGIADNGSTVTVNSNLSARITSYNVCYTKLLRTLVLISELSDIII